MNARTKVELTDDEKTIITDHYLYILRNVDKYGNPDGTNDCLRYKYHADKKRNLFKCIMNGKHREVFAYNIAFMYHNGYYPKRTRLHKTIGISHICGKQGCIIKDHMIVEPQTINNDRWICHKWICKYMTKYVTKMKKGQINVEYLNKTLTRFIPDNDKHECSHKGKPCFISRTKHK